MPVTWLPGHITHIMIAGIYAGATAGITSLEVFYIKSFGTADFFFLIIQNVGIMATSGYFASKINISEKGLSETNKGA
jgi:hypothetical protein